MRTEAQIYFETARRYLGAAKVLFQSDDYWEVRELLMKSETIYKAIYDKLARYYDMTHKMHPYKAQTDFADMVFQKYGNGGKRVIDVCCGTGGHARYMIEKGYDVTGIDLSQDMLAIAERKFRNNERKPSFIQKDVTKLDFDEEFDGAYCFNAFFHMTTYGTVVESLKGIQRSLKEGGAFTFDVFNGWQMLDTTPHMHISHEGDTKVIEFNCNRTVDKMRRVKCIESLWFIEENGHISLELDSYELRMFFHDELMFLLENSGFEPLVAYGDDLTSEFTPDSRFITFVARKR
jgi:ubiquinone/menaquinone biosynthesis C-methylase UbiE